MIMLSANFGCRQVSATVPEQLRYMFSLSEGGLNRIIVARPKDVVDPVVGPCGVGCSWLGDPKPDTFDCAPGVDVSGAPPRVAGGVSDDATSGAPARLGGPINDGRGDVVFEIAVPKWAKSTGSNRRK